MDADQQAKLNAALFLQLEANPPSREAIEAINNYTRMNMRQGRYFESVCKPWLMQFLDYQLGKCEAPGPQPPMYPPDDWTPPDGS